jgi:hypothetical protein
MAEKYWMGPAPEKCDLCSTPITKVFIDGATSHGPWGNMCPTCHAFDGRGLGVGRGQKYQKQADGRWQKVGG